MINRTGRVVGQRLGVVDLNHYVDQWVFHRLEKAKRAIELHACLSVFGSGLQQPFTRSNHIGGNETQSCSERLVECCATLSSLCDNGSFNVIKRQPSLIPRQVNDRIGRNGQALCVGLNED